MTTKADFTEEEWEDILEGPPAAGFLVSISEKGGTFREAISIAKAYAEAAKQHGGSELMDEIVNTKPKVDKSKRGSQEELKEHQLTHLRQVVGILETKATREEIEGYKAFVVTVAEHVAHAKKEHRTEVSAAEETAIGDIKLALGLS